MSKKQVLLVVLSVGLLAYLATGKRKPLPDAESPAGDSLEGEIRSARNETNASALKAVRNPAQKADASTAQQQQQTQKPNQLNSSTINKDNSQQDSVKRQEFVAVTEKALKELPKKSDFAHLTNEDVHTIPTVLLEKGRILADIVEAVDENPSLEPDAEKFFKSCAADSNMAIQIRGRCLSHFRRIAAKLGTRVSSNDFPEDVSRLADFIP